MELKTVKTKLHAAYTKSVGDVKKRQQTHDKARDSYYDSVKQAETAVINKDAAEHTQMPAKAVQKLAQRVDQTKREVDTLHAAYKKSVEQLQEAQTAHDALVADALMQFEKLERARLQVMLQQLSKFAHLHDGVQATAEEVRTVLVAGVSKVNTDADVTAFIKAHITGAKPAPHVEYLPMRSLSIGHAVEYKVSIFIACSCIPLSCAVLCVYVPGVSADALDAWDVWGCKQPSGALPAQASQISTTSSASSVPPQSSQVSSQSVGPPPLTGGAAQAAKLSFVGTAKALYDFEANEPDDLPFKTGQIINVS